MTREPHILLLGGGGHALVVAEAAVARQADSFAGFLDDSNAPSLADATFHGSTNKLVRIPRVGPLAGFPESASSLLAHHAIFLSIGDLAARARVLKAIASHPAIRIAPTIIHQSAEISPTARIEPGTFIGPRAIVHTLARIEAHAILNSGSIIEHECHIGVNSHIAPGAVLGGRVRIGDHTLIGLGARVLPNRRIGSRCTIGAGAVVTHDIPDGTTLVGVPARPIRYD